MLKASAPAYALGLVRGRELVSEELAAIVAQVRRDGQIRETELIIRRPGLSARHVTARVAPLSSQLVLALVEDRTRERQVEAVRRDFVANVSHELKTPIGALRLLAEAVQDAADDPEAVQRFGGRMITESERLTRLVQQVIELSRLQGDEPVDAALAHPGRRGRQDRRRHQRDRRRRPPDLDRHRRHAGLEVFGSSEQITAAVANLVANAVAYSEEGSTVLVSTKGLPDSVEISVVDQGIGIPEARWTGSSSGSTASTRPATAPPAAPGSGCRSSSTSPPPMVAT